MTQHEVINNLIQFLNRTGIPQKKAAKDIGITPNRLNVIIRSYDPYKNPVKVSLPVLKSIENYLNNHSI